MGQLMSSSHNIRNHDQLVSYLIKREYIVSIDVEKVFRCVNRTLYYTEDNNQYGYRDTAWQSGKAHLSAPSVYAAVLENLELQKGHKFLNIGSGIGHLSTLAGLLLGVNGVNHGIEIHKSLIDLAHQKLEEFKQRSAAIDYFELCEPVFLEGNACELLSLGYYDRVYCGAAVPRAESTFMKSLIKVGGILVMPFEGYLVRITRQSEYIWKKSELLEVTFSDLIVPEKCSVLEVLKFPTVEPLSLQELCRSKIRASIRDCLNESNNDLQMHTKCKTNKRYDPKFLDSDDPLSQFVRLQYGQTERGMISLRNIVDTFAGLDDSMSDSTGNEVSDFEINSDVEDDGNEDNEEEKSASEQCDKSLNKKTEESDTKRKSLEAGCSEQNKTLPETPENTKRMKMNVSNTTPPLINQLINGPCTTNMTSAVWDTINMDPSADADADDDDDDSEGWVSSSDENTLNGGLVPSPDDFGGRVYNSLFNDDQSNNDSDSDSEVSEELPMYRFQTERKENELSKLMKVKIDQLPIPTMLKLFLNYDKED